MAHGVTSGPIVVHQALHGYADGHRLLASSIALKPRDAKIVLTLSDASGSTSGITDSGYLTGYPLPEAGLYALAKTWPAPEMPRPGCVWTHTILIDFADLAVLGDLSNLAQLFVRPMAAQTSSGPYGADLLLSFEELPASSLPLVDDPSALRRLLWALYGEPDERIISTDGDDAEREAMVLMLWSQQWPSLRRSFRFCTLVFSDRSTESAPFDLQFASRNDRAHRSRLGKLFDADRDPPESPGWLESALRDLVVRTTRDLRAFLRAFGAETGGGRGVFAPLCELHDALAADPPNSQALSRAVSLLDGTLSAAEAHETRALLARRLISVAAAIGPDQVTFIMRHLGSVPSDDLDAVAAKIGRVLWDRDPGDLLRLLASDVAAEVLIARRTVRELPTPSLLEGLGRHPEFCRSVLDLRPEVLSERNLWRAEEPFGHVVLEVALSRPPVPEAVLEAMIESGNASLAAPVSASVGEDTVVAKLIARLEQRGAEQTSSQEAPWLTAAGKPNAIARALSHGVPHEKASLWALAHHVRPDDVPNEYGEDPWWSGIRATRGELSPTSNELFRSWVLARGLGYRSRNQAELLSYGFETVYVAALEARLSDVAWRYLDDRLPNSNFWSDWDRTRRLRAGIIAAFLDRDLDPGAFGRLLGSEHIFGELASEALRTWGGRGFLRRVKRTLRESGANRYDERIANLDRLLW